MSERTDSWAKGEMRLSEAIRIGAMMHEQLHGQSVERDENGNIIRSCALVGAAIAAGYDLFTPDYIQEFYLEQRAWHPVYNLPMSMLSIIVSLNDPPHNWTRNAIADWVESEENKEIERHEQAVREEREWQDSVNSLANGQQVRQRDSE